MLGYAGWVFVCAAQATGKASQFRSAFVPAAAVQYASGRGSRFVDVVAVFQIRMSSMNLGPQSSPAQIPCRIIKSLHAGNLKIQIRTLLDIENDDP